MSLLEELYGEDEAEEAEALERVIEGGSDEGERHGDDEAEEAEEDKRKVEPGAPKTVRVVKHPRVVLNPARLTGPRGLQALPEHFKDFKFKGKGHEADDLDVVLKRLEHWAHRLYPKFQFDDCLKKIETLGKKRPVTVLLRKIRSDQLVSDEIVTQRDSSDDETPARPEPAPEEEEFDKLLAEQVQLARATPVAGARGPMQTPARSLPMAPKATSSPSISEEQKQRMLKNRQMAEERRLARMRQSVANTPISNRTFDNNTPCANKIIDDTTEVVDLTDFNPAAHLVSTEINKSQNPKKHKEIIDMTVEEEAPKRVAQVSRIIRSEDYNEIGQKDCSTVSNHSEKKSYDVSDSSDDDFGKYNSISDQAKTTKNSEISTNDNEISMHRTKELTALHYSDSSDEDCEVTTLNVSVSADVHRSEPQKLAEDETMPEQDTVNASSFDVIKGKTSDLDVIVEEAVKEKETEIEISSKDDSDIGRENVICDKNDNMNNNNRNGEVILLNETKDAVNKDVDIDMNDDWGIIDDNFETESSVK